MLRLPLTLIALGAAVLLSTSAWAQTKAAPAQPAAPAAMPAGDVHKITITNELIGDKKTWLPTALKIPAGKKLELTLVNTLADPHGFDLPGVLKEPIVVLGKETKTVSGEAVAKGTYKFSCQLHPAHVGGAVTAE